MTFMPRIKNMGKFPLVSLLLTLSLFPASGQMKYDTTRLRAFLDHLESQKGAMGVVAIHHHGKPLCHHAFGFAQINPRQKNSLTTRFRIGSITKTYTATLIHQLVLQGKLNLHDTLSQWFPDFPNADRITLEQMLLHRSGLYNFTNSPRYHQASDSSLSRSALLQWMKSGSPAFAPGTQFGYSNTNYVLLGFIAEEVSNRSLSALLQSYIFDPLQLPHTTFGLRPNEKYPEAKSYAYSGKSWTPDPNTHLNIPLGAGAIVSTAREVAVFFDALFRGKLLSMSVLSKMKPQAYNYGHGLLKIPFYQRTSYGHTGGIDHFRTAAAYFPADSLTVVVLTNGLRMKFNDLLIGVLSTLYGRDYPFPTIKESAVLSNQWLQNLSGLYKSPNFPLDITISVENGRLKGQATGQPSFLLEAKDSLHYALPEADLKMHFIPQENRLELTQFGATYSFTRKSDP